MQPCCTLQHALIVSIFVSHTHRSGSSGQVGGPVAVRERDFRRREHRSSERAARPPAGEERHFREEECYLVSILFLVTSG